ncbi:MAG: AAA family ATPase [Bacteroidetes bacterium]|nr:AAA family ATPase [Bacteroidota bacterium]
MNISRIQVTKLFDELDHDLEYTDNERMMILTGLNGSGKTTILHFIDVLFNKSLTQLCNIPFGKVKIFFDNRTSLSIEKNDDHQDEEDQHLPLLIQYYVNEDVHQFVPSKTLTTSVKTGRGLVSIEGMMPDLHLSSIDSVIPELRRVSALDWENSETGLTLNLVDVLIQYSDRFRYYHINEVLQTPEWFQDLKSSINAKFIDTDRLTHVAPMTFRHLDRDRFTPTVNQYSKHLTDIISDLIVKYGALSQALDSTFPARVVNNRQHNDLSIETLRDELVAIENKRVDLEKAGLIEIDQSHIAIPDLSNIDHSQIDMLSVYTKDVKKKLAVFDDLYEKVSVFRRILNSRYSNKKISVSANGLRVSKNGSASLKLELLSSGEQHELVMLYDLLFRAPKNSLILIDEPEISLHVAWQEQWLDDLNEIIALTDSRAIVATHSPEIIGRRLNLSVELHSSR